MYRYFVAGAALVLLTLPTPSEAATITQCNTAASPCGVIGTFSWDETFDPDGNFTGHLFTLVNSSDIPDSPVTNLDPSELGFTAVVLTVDGVEYPLFEALPGLLADSLGLPFFDPITSASISFVLLGTQFFVPSPEGSSFTSPQAVDIYAEIAVVPEPASALLMTAGVTAVIARRRYRDRSSR